MTVSGASGQLGRRTVEFLPVRYQPLTDDEFVAALVEHAGMPEPAARGTPPSARRPGTGGRVT